MQLTNYLVNKFGSDKLLHFLLAAWLTSWFTDFGYAISLPAAAAIFLLAWIKEKFLDDHFDHADLAASLGGILTELIAYGIRAALAEGVFGVTMPM